VQTQKKIKETDAIFTKLKAVNKAADEAKSVLRLSWDAKATVKLGDFSRGARIVCNARRPTTILSLMES